MKSKYCFALTECCFSYPSGRVAITVTSRELGQFRYILQDDHEDPALPNVVGMFCTDGHAATFFSNNGQPR